MHSFQFEGKSGSPQKVQIFFDKFRGMLEFRGAKGHTEVKKLIAPVIYSKGNSSARRRELKRRKRNEQGYQNLKSDRSL